MFHRLLISALLATLAMASPALAQQGLRWETNLDAAQRQAAQSNRLVLIHFTAPWCNPCQRLEQTVFSKPGFGAALESQFVAVKLDLDHNKAVAQQYGVRFIPADVIVTPQGQLVQLVQSPATADQYVGTMQQIAARATPGRYPANVAAAQPPAGAPGYAPPNTVPAYAPPSAVASTQPASDPFAAQTNSTAPSAQPSGWSGSLPPPYRSDLAPSQPPAAVAATPTAQPPIAAPVAQPPYAPPQVAQAPIAPPAQPAAAQPPVVSQVSRTAGSPNVALASAANSAAPAASKAPLAVDPSKLPPGSPPLGLDGFCPVSLVERKKWVAGDPLWGAIHRGRTYLFCGEGERQRFMANPDRFSPVASGNDPVLANQGKAVEGSRKHGVTYEGRIYLFSDENTLAEFHRNPTRYSAEYAQARR